MPAFAGDCWNGRLADGGVLGGSGVDQFGAGEFTNFFSVVKASLYTLLWWPGLRPSTAPSRGVACSIPGFSYNPPTQYLVSTSISHLPYYSCLIDDHFPFHKPEK
jgi:hypothetical protein